MLASMLYTTLLLSMCAVLVQSQAGDIQQCQETKPEEITVALHSRRNQTGHWISQVELQSNDNTFVKDESTSGEWSVNIKPRSADCRGESTMKVLLTFTEPPRRVGPDYSFFPGIGYYKFHVEAETWPRAREICAEEGTHLVIINSKEESGVMVKLFTKYPKINSTGDNIWAWIGAHETGVNNAYFTIFGELLNSTGFVNWASGQPDDTGPGDGLAVTRGAGDLADSRKSNKKAFICEQEM